MSVPTHWLRGGWYSPPTKEQTHNKPCQWRRTCYWAGDIQPGTSSSPAVKQTQQQHLKLKYLF